MARPPFWRESRVGLETAALLRARCSAARVKDGRGRPVLLIPGFLAGDDSLGLMTRWLRRNGYHTSKAGIRANVACSEQAVDRIEDRLQELVERQGRRAAIVGQSRGGSFARVLARRRPDLVAGIVTLGTAHNSPLAVHPLVTLNIIAVGALGTLRVPGLFSRSCLSGACCAEFWNQAEAPLPRRVASSPSTRAATASSTGAPASRTAPSTRRSAPATSAWRSTPPPTGPWPTASRRSEGASGRAAPRRPSRRFGGLPDLPV